MAVLRKRYSADGTRYRWVVDYRLKGKRNVKSTGTDDRKIAETVLKAIEADLALGRFGFQETVDRSPLLSAFIEDYLTYSKANKAKKTYQTDGQTLRSFLSFIGDGPLSAITPELAERFKAKRMGQISATSVNIALRHLKSIFSTAQKWGHLDANPFRPVKLLKIPKRPPNFLTKEEIGRLLNVIDDADFKRLIRFYLLTGLRHIETLQLRWRDVDADREILKVTGKGGKQRSIPINHALREILDSLPRDSEYVFCSARTKGMREYFWVSKKFRKYADRAGLPKATLHTLRHTFASHLVMSGVDLPTVQQLLGHASITTTMVYTHLLDSHLKKAMEKVVYW